MCPESELPRPWAKFPKVLGGDQVKRIYSQEFIYLLPVSQRDDYDNLVAPDSECLLQALDNETHLERLDIIHQYLWLAGRPMPPRPLHHQRTLNREIYITEKMDTHLVWCEGRIYIKPLPRFVLEPCFWEEELPCSCSFSPVQYQATPAQRDKDACRCKRIDKYRARAWGLLFSYAALVSGRSDFEIAKANCLIPEDLDWTGWHRIVTFVLSDRNLYQSVDRRFQFGELRLGRLDKIYFYWQDPGNGYMPRWNQYKSFFRDNFGFLLSSLAYVAIVLTAMQVGLSTKLQDSTAFQSVSYGFTIFAILSPVGALGLMAVVFLCLFVVNWVATRTYLNVRREQFYRHRVREGDICAVNGGSGTSLSQVRVEP